MSHNSTTTCSYKATETGKTTFFIKNANGYRREVDGEMFARYIDKTIKKYLRKIKTLEAQVEAFRKDSERYNFLKRSRPTSYPILLSMNTDEGYDNCVDSLIAEVAMSVVLKKEARNDRQQ